jgi:leader peptidase (prepilin peptidase)/N-methyltransferase
MEVFWTIFLFVFGACVGSFLNVAIYRLPRGESIVFPGSHCPRCGRAIRWFDNIPLLSWLALGGNCRFCKEPISPRYILIEFATAVMVAGLYVCYYVLRIREGAGRFEDTWPMFLAHAALLCGLLVCTAVDIEKWIVPLEVCWFVTLAGLVSSAASPQAWMPKVSPAMGAASVGAGVGLVLGLLLLRYGLLQQSFIDAADKPVAVEDSAKGKKKPKPPAVAFTRENGVSPRKEILRELLFLAPAVALAIIAWLLVTHVACVGEPWRRWTDPSGGGLARHVNGFLSALLGYLVGGAWIWGVRILGTLGFNKEAMGLGDAHILGAVGAATGWFVPTVVFFVAPLFGILWAMYLWLRRGQRELPYGPWLAAATLTVLLFYDSIVAFLKPYGSVLYVSP